MHCSPLIILVPLLWASFDSSVFLVLQSQDWRQYRWWIFARAESENHLLQSAAYASFVQSRIWLAFWVASAYCWFQVLIYQYYKVFPGIAALSVFITQAGLPLDYPDPGAASCTRSCWKSQGSNRPTSQVWQVPSGWHSFPQVYQMHHTAYCHLQICWWCT